MSESNENSVCQHCEQQVEWGRTEQGFLGFVHLVTGEAVCPQMVYVVKTLMEGEGEDLCGQAFRTVEGAWSAVAEIVADWVRDELVLTHSDATGLSFAVEGFGYDTAWIVVERLPLV